MVGKPSWQELEADDVIIPTAIIREQLTHADAAVILYSPGSVPVCLPTSAVTIKITHIHTLTHTEIPKVPPPR